MKISSFEETFPQNSEVRTTKINALKSSYQAASRILVTSMTQQQTATQCSLRVLWILGKHKKPFSDAETIKERVTEVMDTMFEGQLTRFITIYLEEMGTALFKSLCVTTLYILKE